MPKINYFNAHVVKICLNKKMILNVYAIKELHMPNALVVKECKVQEMNLNALVVKWNKKLLVINLNKNALADKKNAPVDYQVVFLYKKKLKLKILLHPALIIIMLLQKHKKYLFNRLKINQKLILQK